MTRATELWQQRNATLGSPTRRSNASSPRKRRAEVKAQHIEVPPQSIFANFGAISDAEQEAAAAGGFFDNQLWHQVFWDGQKAFAAWVPLNTLLLTDPEANMPSTLAACAAFQTACQQYHTALLRDMWFMERHASEVIVTKDLGELELQQCPVERLLQIAAEAAEAGDNGHPDCPARALCATVAKRHRRHSMITRLLEAKDWGQLRAAVQCLQNDDGAD